MTGKDLIIYILQNNLENEEVFKDGKLIGFMSIYEAAAKLQVGVAAVRVMIELSRIKAFDINGMTYVSAKDVEIFKTLSADDVEKMKNNVGGPLDE